jgi:hypothetical protein
MTTNLRSHPSGDGLAWGFDLAGIADMYASYEDTCLWDLLHAPPQVSTQAGAAAATRQHARCRTVTHRRRGLALVARLGPPAAHSPARPSLPSPALGPP